MEDNNSTATLETQSMSDNNSSGGEEEEQTILFQPGDHVYAWAVGRVYQHHGIVLRCDGNSLVIADFVNMVPAGTNCMPSSSSWPSSFPTSFPTASNSSFPNGGSSTMSQDAIQKKAGVGGEMRVITEENMEDTNWKKVKYNATWRECITCRAGTVSLDEPDPPHVVLKRTNFLLQNTHLIPPYHILYSNCETVASWCATGKWSTMQVAAALEMGKTLGISGIGAGVAYACAQTTTVVLEAAVMAETASVVAAPVATAAEPMILPLVGMASAASAIASTYRLYKCKKEWSQTNKTLDVSFAETVTAQ